MDTVLDYQESDVRRQALYSAQQIQKPGSDDVEKLIANAICIYEFLTTDDLFEV